jgi:tRNA A-37 threonylcarbamoyl transferase component Bud32
MIDERNFISGEYVVKRCRINSINEVKYTILVSEKTKIRVPEIIAYNNEYIVMEYIEGPTFSESFNDMDDSMINSIVIRLVKIISELKNKIISESRVMGSLDNLSSEKEYYKRIIELAENPNIKIPSSEEIGKISFCHGDLRGSNIILNEECNEIRAIIDWEYAGYYPDKISVYNHPCICYGEEDKDNFFKDLYEERVYDSLGINLRDPLNDCEFLTLFEWNKSILVEKFKDDEALFLAS